MAATQISLSRTLELGVTIAWQEAVALVEEVAQLEAIRRAKEQPPAALDEASVMIDVRGDVLLPVVTATERPDGELQLLRALLVGENIPADLEALAYGQPPAHVGDALAMFSRPDRRGQIAALAARALDADAAATRLAGSPPVVTAPAVPLTRTTERSSSPAVAPATDASAEIERLRSRENLRAGTTATRKTEAVVGRPNRRTLGAALAAVALVGVIGGAWWLSRVVPATAVLGESVSGEEPGVVPEPAAAPSQLPSASPAVSPAASASPGASATRARRSASPPPVARPTDFGQPPPVTAARAGDISLAQPGPRRQSLPPVALGSPPSYELPASRVAPPVAPPTAPPPPPATAAEPVRSEEAAFTDGQVHTWRTSQATPPVMTYPRMPHAAFPARGVEVDGQFLEVLVDASGQVAGVRLTGQAATRDNAYRNRMLLSAAKAWVFTPASLNGRPVPYVTRVVPEP